MVGQGTIDLIRGGDCGYAVASGNYEALTNVIANVVLTNVDEFKKKGINGRRMYENEFTLDKCIDHLEEIIS